MKYWNYCDEFWNTFFHMIIFVWICESYIWEMKITENLIKNSNSGLRSNRWKNWEFSNEFLISPQVNDNWIIMK